MAGLKTPVSVIWQVVKARTEGMGLNAAARGGAGFCGATGQGGWLPGSDVTLLPQFWDLAGGA